MLSSYIYTISFTISSEDIQLKYYIVLTQFHKKTKQKNYFNFGKHVIWSKRKALK